MVLQLTNFNVLDPQTAMRDIAAAINDAVANKFPDAPMDGKLYGRMRGGWTAASGLQGPQGPAGPQGAQGAEGPPGPAGPQGDVGPAGPQGPQGNTGTQGPIGLTGPTGVQGPKGDTGAAGAPGQTGLQGPKGDQGLQGPQGLVGPTGAQGPQGSMGPGGPAGPTAVSTDAGNLAKLGTDNLLLVTHDAAKYDASNPSGYQTAAQVTTALAPYAPLASPALSGNPTCPTQPLADADTSIASTAFVRTGVTDGSNAAAGMVGEQLAASQTTAVSLTTGVTANIATLALSAGDWSVSGVIVFAEGANALPTALAAAIATASATLPTAAQVAAGTGNLTQYNLAFPKGAITQTMQAGVCRISGSAPTNVYLAAQGTFAGGTLTATGYISARRVR